MSWVVATVQNCQVSQVSLGSFSSQRLSIPTICINLDNKDVSLSKLKTCHVVYFGLSPNKFLFARHIRDKYWDPKPKYYFTTYTTFNNSFDASSKH